VYHVVVLSVQSNVSDYTVVIESEQGLKKQTILCPESLCVIPDIAPLDYVIAIEKDGYTSQILDIHL